MDFLLTLILFAIVFFLIARAILNIFIRRTTPKYNTTENTANKKRSRRGNVAYKDEKTTVISHGEERSEVPNNFGEYIDFEEIENE
ncbi:MAG: DUF4834 family protein [Bacteroidales bacterium]|jgi:hypothetical protein|nr:DUF4834 family protein [Bacteroidales bacterium]